MTTTKKEYTKQAFIETATETVDKIYFSIALEEGKKYTHKQAEDAVKKLKQKEVK